MLKGDNIYLRVPEPIDVDFILEMENNPSFWRVSETLFPYSRFEIESFIFEGKHDLFSQRQVRFIICDLQNDFTIGMVDLFDFHPLYRRVGIGVLITQSDQGRGLAAEAISIVEDYAKKVLSIHQIFCNIHSDNIKSLALFSSLGYGQQGVFKDWELYNGQFLDVYFFQKILSN